MKTSNAMNVAVNLAVIGFVGLYLFHWIATRDGANPDTDQLSYRDLSQDEWNQLIGGASVVGNESVRPVAVEFSDYQCQYCASTQRQLAKYLEDQQRVAVFVRHFPLPSHEAAKGAARAAICAEAQGLFQQMHFRLFEQSDWHESQDWTKLAKEIGVDDIRQFSECLHSAATEARLEGDQALALEFGIRAVPTFVFRDATYTGQLNRWTLRDLVNRRQD